MSTSHAIDAVRAGERVTLTVHGEPVADIDELAERSSDARLAAELDDPAGQTLDDL